MTLILWATLSKPEWKIWPEAWDAVRNPLHSQLTIVAGTLAIFLVGILISKLWQAMTGGKRAELRQ